METVVATGEGKLRGRMADGVASFLGIPYAAAPFGPNRFAAPQPVAGWDGIRDAVEYGPTVPKPEYARPFDKLLVEPVIPGEDCLNLNVWTPDPGGAGLPVMVWIHGGAFRNGSGSVPVYDGSAFARDGVVCVTINYRLGVEGFGALPGAPANRGLLDQLAALRWVRRNIAAFGGDPDRVTVFGESAGGMSVSTLLSLDVARTEGLFHRAIAQSGAGAFAQDPADALLVTREIAGRLGVEPTAAGFAAVAPEAVVAAQAAVAAEVSALPDPGRWGRTTAASAMAQHPVLDGELLTRRPEDAVGQGAGRDVDLLVGYTAEEFRFFLVPNGLTRVLTPEISAAILAGVGFDTGLQTSYQRFHPDASAGDLLCEIITDGFFRIPAYRLAERHHAASGTGSTHVYEFAWRTPVLGMGACHGLELGFVFDTLPSARSLTGDDPPQSLATTMHKAWVDFAVHGDPGWPAFTPEDRPVKVFDGAADPVVGDPRSAQRLLWSGPSGA
jgi:para-nitrobenzyl esterase